MNAKFQSWCLGDYKMKKLFDVPDSYKEHITKFDSSDGFLALGIIVTYFVVMTISGIIVQYISQLQITIIGGGINVFFVVLVLLCLKMRHQGIETIGLKEGNIRLSFVLAAHWQQSFSFVIAYQMYCLSTNLLLILQIY